MELNKKMFRGAKVFRVLRDLDTLIENYTKHLEAGGVNEIYNAEIKGRIDAYEQAKHLIKKEFEFE